MIHDTAQSSGTFTVQMNVLSNANSVLFFTITPYVFSNLTICDKVHVSMEVAMSALMEQNNLGSRMSQWECLKVFYHLYLPVYS